MNHRAELFFQCIIHQAVTLQAGTACKAFGYDLYGEVAATGFTCTGMSCMPGGVVSDLNRGRFQLFQKDFSDVLCARTQVSSLRLR